MHCAALWLSQLLVCKRRRRATQAKDKDFFPWPIENTNGFDDSETGRIVGVQTAIYKWRAPGAAVRGQKRWRCRSSERNFDGSLTKIVYKSFVVGSFVDLSFTCFNVEGWNQQAGAALPKLSAAKGVVQGAP